MHSLFSLADAANNAAGVFFGLGTVGLILVLVASVFWLWMLIDALTNRALDSTMKLVWALVIFFLHILGALIYFFVARKSPVRA
jgi:Phospholipase_D-nuclease N-terminal